jgi:DNA-binding transcriptional ArsR family regulator
VLGNPVSFAVVCLLVERKDMTPSEIAKAVGRSVSRISNVLASLRLAEIVRYDADGRHARYRLKHPREVQRVLGALNRFVKAASAVRPDA